MATTKTRTSKAETATPTASKKDTPATASSTTVAAANKRAAEAEDVAEKALARIKRLEKQAERLKTLDKIGVGKHFSGFVAFLREKSVVGLAIGLVLGTQAKALVDQLIASFANPLVGLLLPGRGTLKDKLFTIQFHGKVAQFGWGAFVISLLSFVIAAGVVYFVFKGLKLDRLDKKKA